MVLINSTTDLYNIIDSLDWFSSIGMPVTKQHNCLPVDSMQEAIKFWTSPVFLEAKSVAWEAFRQEIVKDSKVLAQWEKEFATCNKRLINSINRSRKAINLISSTKEDNIEFCRSLPFTAALGELLIVDKHPDYIFNISQIPFFIEGHWVCGWNGILYEDKFVYPELNFMVY